MRRIETPEQRKERIAERAIDGAKATEDYRAAERAAAERIAGLREARMARNAALAEKTLQENAERAKEPQKATKRLSGKR